MATALQSSSATNHARRRTSLWRWAALATVCVITLIFIAAGIFYAIARAALPQLDDSIAVEGIHAPVQVLRDAQGVPHIKAQSMEDLLFAQGYVTAQDRLWQMDMSRRYAAGEMAEVLGSGLLEHDRKQRILSLRQVAERSVAQLSDEQRRLFQQYVNGINRYVETHHDNLSIEFHVLHYAPRPWTMEDSFLVGANMAQTLNYYNFRDKLKREKVTQKLGAALAAELYVSQSRHDIPPASQMEAQQPPHNAAQGSNDGDDDEDAMDTDTSVTRVQRTTPDAAARQWWMEQAAFPAGSNNWVVSGAHTVTGKPLLSNDMHLDHQIPNVWYEAHLEAGDFDVAGVTLPGLPFVIVGHNRRIAWGYTNVGADVIDIYIENFNAQDEYETPAGWKKPETRHEVIHVRGQVDVQLDVVSTRHGPIVSDLAPGESRKLALRWTLYDAGLTAPFGELNAAQNWEQVRQAFRNFSAPGQNVVYADVDGNIGYQATGIVPIRASGDGSVPVPGRDDAHEWKGYIPFDEMPRVYNPPTGILATANSRITPDNYVYLISNNWEAPFRTERIYRVLESGRKFSAADMLALETDVYSEIDFFCAERFVSAVEHSPKASAQATEAAALLRSWNGRMIKNSPAAAIEVLARHQLFDMILEPKLGALAEDYDWSNSPVALENILTRQPTEWLPAGFANYDELLLAALEATVKESGARRGLKPLRLGALRPLELSHPIFGRLPVLRHWAGPGSVQQSGGPWTIKIVDDKLGPSERMTVDLAHLDDSKLNIVNGESGELFSPYFNNQWKAWYEGTSFTLPFSDQAVEKAAVHRLTLAPSRMSH